jgi:hypothetical protein
MERAIDQLLSLLPTASKALKAPIVPATPAPAPAPEPEPDKSEDIIIQQALDKVLEYHRTHRPKNTTNYEPKQQE